MEDMDIDQVMDVPDTPDRSAERNIDGRKCDKHDSSSLASAHSGNSKDKGVLNQLRGRGRLVTENGHSRRLHFRSRESSANSVKLSAAVNPWFPNWRILLLPKVLICLGE